MDKPPQVSAIVISFNGMDFLPDCLRTLTDDLEGCDHEVIVVDNGSHDGSADYVRENYPELKLIENDSNLGFAPAVNIGLKAARGEYLYVLNQDLRFPKGTLSKLMTRLGEDESIGLIGPKYIGFDGTLQKSARAFPSYRHILYRALFLDRMFPEHKEYAGWRMGWFDHETEMFLDQPMGAVMLIPRKVIEKVGYMDESFPILFNDVDFCRRIKEGGFKLLYYPGAVVEHFVGGSTRKIPVKLHWISHNSMFRYLRKYAKPQDFLLLWLCGFLLYASLIPLTIVAWLRHRS